MKAFVIKNKEGKYKVEDVGVEIQSLCVRDIRCAEIFTDKELAECCCPSDCEPVEITIEEVDNSKREYNETIKYIETTEPDKVAEHIDNLEQQLAEKDKIIEQLNFEKRNIFGLIEKMEVKLAGVTKEKIQEIRKQVCDMARKKIIEATCYDTEEEVRNVIYDLNASTALEILDEIEKGE